MPSLGRCVTGLYRSDLGVRYRLAGIPLARRSLASETAAVPTDRPSLAERPPAAITAHRSWSVRGHTMPARKELGRRRRWGGSLARLGTLATLRFRRTGRGAGWRCRAAARGRR